MEKVDRSHAWRNPEGTGTVPVGLGFGLQGASSAFQGCAVATARYQEGAFQLQLQES